MVNELAPRPHNSGHLTFDAAVTSNSNSNCAICGLPLGSTELVRPAAMATCWATLGRRRANWAAHASARREAALYGKDGPRPGSKMGHLTALVRRAQEAQERVIAARDALLIEQNCRGFRRACEESSSVGRVFSDPATLAVRKDPPSDFFAAV